MGILNDDDGGKLASQEEVEEKIVEADDVDLDSEEEKQQIANFVDDQIRQALTVGRLESDVRSTENGMDPVVAATAVSAASSVITALMFAYQFYM